MKKITFLCSLFLITSSSIYATKFYVDKNAASGGDGTSWATAKQSIGEAQGLGVAWDSIMVKTGTYEFTSAFNFVIQKKFYGGCVGNESSPTQRPLSDLDGNGIIEPWEFTYPTILTSSLSTSTFGYSGNSATRVDGFTFTSTATSMNINNRFLTVGNATNIFVNNTVKEIDLSLTLTATTNAILFRSLGNVSNCLFENNVLTINATYNGTLTPTVSIEGGKMYNCILRNNKVNLTYDVASNNARGLILNVNAAISPGASVYNTLIYNNEMVYVQNGGTSTATMTNASAVSVYANTTVDSYDSLYNCVIANNKGTKINIGGLKIVNAGSAVSKHIVANNIIWNNQNDGIVSDVVGTSIVTGSLIANNYTKGTSFTNNGGIIIGNTQSTSPNFISPSTGVGNSQSVTDGSINTSIWKISNGSDLIEKGVDVTYGNQIDKSVNLYASIPSVGAYEFYGYNFRSNTTGNWSNASSWQTSTDNTNWNSTSITPNADAASIKIKSGDNLTISENAFASTLTINPGAGLTLNSGKKLTTNSLNLSSDANGNGTFINNGGTISSASTNVQQYLTSGRNWYISSPVSGATTSAINTITGSSILSYDEVHGTSAPWVTESTTLTSGKGYIVASPTNVNPTINFSGTLNTGEITIPLTRTAGQTKEGFNLIGNPYPSYVNWQSATKTNVGSTIWYRTKNTSSTFVFDTYNASTNAGTNNNLSGAVSGLIPPMQAVWVRVDQGQTTGSVVFNNNMRSHATGSTTPLKVKSLTATEHKLLRFRISNGTNSDEAIIVIHPEASNEFDAFDSEKMTNNNVNIPEIYTLAGTEKVVINGINSIPANDELTLGFTTGQSNTFNIQATELENVEDTRIFIRDNLRNTTFELTNKDAYTFTSDATSSTDRFVIVFKSSSITTDMHHANLKDVKISGKDGKINIFGNMHFSTNDMVSVYNNMGQLIMNTPLMSSNQTLSNSLVPGVYMVTLFINGEKRTDKIILQ